MRRFPRRAVAPLAALVIEMCASGAHAAETAWLTPGPRLPDAALVDQDGRAIRLDAAVNGRPVIVHFFYTTCATICPVQTAVLRDARTLLDRRNAGGAKPLILSVAIEPDGAAPGALRHYADQFDIRLGDAEGWLMLSGAPETIRLIRSAFDERTPAAEHSGALWIGSPVHARWTRVPFNAPAASQPAAIASLVEEAAR
jgi:protein SCO1/2